MGRLTWISADDPPDRFPSPGRALREPSGLLAAGGDLSLERLEAAYRRGIFPWYSGRQPILWWSPDPRAVLWPERLHLSRRLRRRLRRNPFDCSVDRAFEPVIGQCAERRRDTGTWITPELRRAFLELHAAGLAHSIEVWQEETLVGGLYGMNIGRIFFAESMFSAVTDASKVAMAGLAARCVALGIELIDCQVPSAHLTTMGCEDMSRRKFLRRLARLCAEPAPAGWPTGRWPCATLIE